MGRRRHAILEPVSKGGLEHSAGGVVVGPGALLALSSHRKKGISLPKGHVEEGETADDTSVREIGEETGIRTLTKVYPLGSFTRLGWRPFNGQALTAAMTAVLPEGTPIEFEGRTELGARALNRRYVMQRRANDDLYLHLEWPQESADVLMRLWKPAKGEWISTAYAWTAKGTKGNGWRRMARAEEEVVLGELPNISWSLRGNIPELGDLPQLNANQWECEYGTITREAVTSSAKQIAREKLAMRRTRAEARTVEAQRVEQQTREYRWNFAPNDIFSAQGLSAFGDSPASEDLLRILRWRVIQGPILTADQVLGRFQPADAFKGREAEFKVIELSAYRTDQEALKPTDRRHTAAWYSFKEAHARLKVDRPADAQQLLLHRPLIEQVRDQILGSRPGRKRPPSKLNRKQPTPQAAPKNQRPARVVAA